MTDSERDRLLTELRTLGAERKRLTAERLVVTRELAHVAKALMTQHNVIDTDVAKTAGVARQSIRTWTGTDSDWRGHVAKRAK